MAHAEKKDGKWTILLDETETGQAGFLEGEFELFAPKKGLIVLSEKTTALVSNPQQKPAQQAAAPVPAVPSATPQPKPQPNPVDEKMYGILTDRKQLSSRIVGKFEKTLNPAELKRFEELVKEGLIEKFKLSEQYKQPVYRIHEKKWLEKKKTESSGQKNSATQAPMPAPGSFSVSPKIVPQNPGTPVSLQKGAFAGQFSLDKDGFAILRTDDDARRISSERVEDFKKGLLKGIKTFDGSFFVIKKPLLEHAQNKILSCLQRLQKADLSTISQQTQLQADVVRAACEFLKEDGQVFEKTKNNFYLV